jgi:predicted Zn-dependent protease
LPEAEREVRIAVEQTTANDVRTRATLADILIQLGKTEEAGKIVDDALAREPNHVDARRSKGRLLVAMGRTAEGIGWLEKAAGGSDAEPWIEIARLRLEAGDAAGALAAAQQAVSRNRGHPWALAMEGHALVASGRREEGVAVLRRALAAGPRRPEVWRTLSRAFESAHETALAAQCRRQAEAFSRF